MNSKDEFLSKAAVELTFSFNKAQWANGAHTVVPPIGLCRSWTIEEVGK